VSVRARLTSAAAAPVNLSFAFTDPELDWDVSKHVQQDGILEVGISQVRLMCTVWLHCLVRLKQHCKTESLRLWWDLGVTA
jgi:hypothetical protein